MKVKELFEEIITRNIKLKISDLEAGYLKEEHSDDILNGSFSAVNIGEYDLVSLRGIYKKITGTLDLEGNKALEDLEFCPKIIGDTLDLGYCRINSLEHAPDKIGYELILRGCENLISLEGIGTKYLFEIGTSIYLCSTIRKNILGILKIKGLSSGVLLPTSIHSNPPLKEATEIINKHLKSGRRLSKCKEELIEAGFKEYAKL